MSVTFVGHRVRVDARQLDRRLAVVFNSPDGVFNTLVNWQANPYRVLYQLTSTSSVVIYIRCSTPGQVVDGVSLAVQRSRAEAWAAANSFSIDGVYADEGISGRKASNRPGLAAALEHVCRSRGALVVYSLSRLARSTRDALAISERLNKAGADLVSLSERIDTTSAAGKMIFRMLAVLAEFERDLVSERTKAALSLKAARHERVGQLPFGFDVAADGVTLVDNKDEQETLAEIEKLRRRGHTWRQVAEDLNRRGRLSKSGSRWTLFNVRKVALRR